MSQPWSPETPHDHAVMQVLQAIRAFSDAMDRMHGGMKGDMEMNATDLAALRMLIMREQRGKPVSPHDVARHLRISTASTTKLLDRLSESGHVERRPHPQRQARARHRAHRRVASHLLPPLRRAAAGHARRGRALQRRRARACITRVPRASWARCSTRSRRDARGLAAGRLADNGPRQRRRRPLTGTPSSFCCGDRI